MGETMAGAILILAVANIYFLPTWVSYGRSHHNHNAIFVLNLLLGWTVLGWIIALVWAFTASRETAGTTDEPDRPDARRAGDLGPLLDQTATRSPRP